MHINTKDVKLVLLTFTTCGECTICVAVTLWLDIFI